MTPRQRQRRNFIVLLFGASVVAVTLVLFALEDNLLFFYSPSQVVEALPQNGEANEQSGGDETKRLTNSLTSRLFNLGGMVVDGSVTRAADNPTVFFALTDYAQTVTVRYVGILPDLFREGQGIVATGKMRGDLFVAERVLAKHDENYMPPEIAESLKKPKAAAREGGDPIGIPLKGMSPPQ